MTNNRTSGLRNILNGGAASLAMSVALMSAGAMGQAVPQTPQVAEASKGQNTDEIVVTGTLIRNPNLTLASPVNVTNAGEIQLRQANVAEDLLRELPGVTPNVGAAVNNGNTGNNFLDLRGLGANRNLVLIDGGRIVPAPSLGFASSGSVDLNDIPLALIDRVDVLTGGASATYGADAISGVANFILKKNFAGIDLNTSQQLTERGDGHYERIDLTVGGNFADDKGNAVVSIGYQKADPVYQGDRNFSQFNRNSFTGRVGGSAVTTPSAFATLGNYAGDTDPATGLLQVNPTTGTIDPILQTFNFNPYNVFQTPFSRYSIFAQANYKASDEFEVYTRGLFAQNRVDTIIAPSGVFGQNVTIPLSNPFLTGGERNFFCADAGISQAACDLGAAATSPTNPDGSVNKNYQTFDTQLYRRTTEAGPRQSTYTTTVFDYRAGVRGALGEHLHYDIYGDYGQSENRQLINGYVGVSKVRQALLATNPTTCLDTTGNCVPLNIFGPSGSITGAQAAFITEQSTTAVRTSLLQAGGHLTGDVGFGSPLSSTPINFAAGAEYREYRASQLADQLAQTAGELGGAGGAVIPFDGGYNVVEGFGEIAVPLISDKPFFRSLTLEAGVRYSSYTISAAGGGGYNTTTYKGGGTWEPVKGLSLRGTYDHAVRAPNLAELFAPNVTGLTNLSTDPCVGAGPTTNAALAAVCIAQGAPAARVAAGNVGAINAGQINETNGGNLALSPEVADTFTLGTIIQPSNLVRGLAFTFDFYQITLNGAITTPTPDDAINACFANVTAASVTSLACSQIGRNPGTGSLSGDPATTRGLFLGLTNQGRLFTDGLDATFAYSHEFGPLKATLGFTGNYVFQHRFKSNEASDTSLNRECSGFYSVNCSFTGSLVPKYSWSQRTTLSFESVDLTLLWRHIAPFSQEPASITSPASTAFPGFGHISSYDYFDLGARIGISKQLTFVATVQNMLDKQPPIVGTNIGSTSYNSGNTYPSTYDVLGRRYAVTLELKY